MKLLIVASRFPYPIEKGDKLRLYYQIKELSKHFDIYLFALTEFKVDNKGLIELRDYCENIKLYRLTKRSISLQLLKAAFQKIPFQIAYFKSTAAKKALQQYVISIKPDQIYYQLARTMTYYINGEHSTSIDLMDAFSFGMRKRAEKSGIIAKAIYNRESNLLKLAEEQCARQFDNLCVISDQDAQRMPQLNNLHVVNNGVDLNAFALSNPKPSSDIVFVGNLGYSPNIKAAKYIANKILPAYSKRYKSVLKYAMYGARPPKELKQLESKNVSLVGFVDDIRDAYLSGKILVAPIFGGMGQQNKILESLALGVPAIVSSEIAKGLNLQDKSEVLIANDPQTFVDCIYSLLNDSSLYESLRVSGRKFVEENYDWSEVCQPLISLIRMD